MTLIPLTPEEDELLDVLEGRRPQDFERFHSLVALLMERHWSALVTHRQAMFERGEQGGRYCRGHFGQGLWVSPAADGVPARPG
jgi:hypothetical protein